MKLIIENFRKFVKENLEIGISKDLSNEDLNKIFDWAGVKDKNLIKHLGSASMGSAYRIDSKDFGKVALKITNDASEAHSVANLLHSGQEHPNVYKVYKVGKLSGTGRPKYIIITELLEQPSQEIQYAMGSLYGLVRMGEKGFHKWRGYGNDPRLDKKIEVIASDGESSKGYSSEQIKSYIDKIASGLTFLNNQGTYFTDLKASNVLQRGDEPVIIDLGRVGVPTYSTIEQI
jgi:serine/threonine protein kinase